MEYADYVKHDNAPVDGFILQGPVSDREAFGPLITAEELGNAIKYAESMIAEGKGQDCMPQDKLPTVFNPPVSAYRWISLVSKG
jgi:hypothetical protein